MGNKQSQSRETTSPTNSHNNNNISNNASTVPESSSNDNNNQENNTIQNNNSNNITDQLQQLFISNSRSRNSNSTSSQTNNETTTTTTANTTMPNDLSNMLSSLFSSSPSAGSSYSSSNNNNSTLASSISRTISGNSGGGGGRLRIFERNGAYFAYANGRLIQLQAPRTCPYCNKQINPFQEEYELHVVKCMTKPRIKSVTFEVTAEHSELINGDKECMICYEEYEIGQMVSRLECFCVFHKSCLETWLSRKQCCPLHMESNSASKAGDDAGGGGRGDS